MRRGIVGSIVVVSAFAMALSGCGSGSKPYAPGAFDGAVPTPAPTPAATAPPSNLADTFPDFNITPPAFTSTTTSLNAEGTATVALTVRTNSAVGAPIALSLRNPAAGVSATFSPASVSPSSSPIPVTMQLRVANPSQGGAVQVLGKSGTLERTASVSYSGYVAPSGFAIAVTPVSGQANSSRTRQFDVTVSQTSGSGEIFLGTDTNNITGDTGVGLVPHSLPSDANITGLPDSVTLSGSSQTFRITVSLAADTASFYYGFGVTASRNGRIETAAVAFFYSFTVNFDVSQQVRVSGNTDTATLTYTPRNPAFKGTLVIDRAPDGTLVDGSGQTLAALPAGTVIAGLPQTLTFDGTGQSRTATFTITAPAGTSSTTYYGLRVKASSSESELEAVLLLQFGFGA